MIFDMVHVWLFLVAVVLLLYVSLDGFSLGVSILFPTAADEAERDQLMNSIAPVWDANQTWVVFAGGALFATFPMIYTVLFSALYIPLFTLLFGLIFRGVAFEFRANSSHKVAWNRAFFWGGLVAAFAQGLVLGAYLGGITVENGMFAGGPFDWLSPYSIMVGCGLVTGYVLLGSTYLILKTTGPVQERAFQQARRAGWGVALFMIIVTIWNLVSFPDIIARWLSTPRIYVVWTFPLLAIGALALLGHGLRRKKERMPFVAALLLFLSGYLGLQAGIYPYAILPDVTVYQAAAQRETMIFTLIGASVVLPAVLAYTTYSYWVFRGKVTAENGYH